MVAPQSPEKLWQAAKKLSADLAHLRPWQAAVLGVIEQPWTLTALAAVVVVSHKSGPLAVALAFVLFSALSTAGVITMFVYSTVRSDVAENRLDDVKGRLVQIGPIAAAVLSALVGATLIAVGVFGLVTNFEARNIFSARIVPAGGDSAVTIGIETESIAR